MSRVCMAVAQMRPDFMVWAEKKLLFKGEEKATGRELSAARSELLQKMSVAWVTGTVQDGANVQRPCVLGYAAAGCLVQVCVCGGGGGNRRAAK